MCNHYTDKATQVPKSCPTTSEDEWSWTEVQCSEFMEMGINLVSDSYGQFKLSSLENTKQQETGANYTLADFVLFS